MHSDSPVTDMIKVKNGTRLTFICRLCGRDNQYRWFVGDGQISPQSLNRPPNYYHIHINETQNGNCTNSLMMTVVGNSVSYHTTIHCRQEAHSGCCCTHPICSMNITANYIAVKLEEESNDPLI